jgi:hypothetical protein
MKAQDETKPQLMSHLISVAANHCRMLGYHRERTYQVDATGYSESMRRLFWTVYVFEKNISLLSGRASSIQDFDVDARSLPITADFSPWDAFFVLSIKLAAIQGSIYDNLYSPKACKQILSDRRQHVTDLASAMRRWRDELNEVGRRYIHYES